MSNEDVSEKVSVLRERLATVEGHIEHLETKIELGDNKVRQGIEVLKLTLTNISSDVQELKELSISEDGKQYIYTSLEELKVAVKSIDTKLDKHLSEHNRTLGYDSAIDNLKDNWVQPVLTALIIAGLLAVANLIGSVI